jgi:hypothetical protein
LPLPAGETVVPETRVGFGTSHLDEALRYILGHDGVWATTADDIAEYYLTNYYDQVKSWIADRKASVAE